MTIRELKDIRKKRPIIAAHRGTSGGNIIQNTVLAYKNAIKQGADIVELDIIRSLDGEFFAFHDGQESLVFGENCNILDLTAQEIEAKKTQNAVGELIEQRIERLDYIIKELDGLCYINLDRSWFYWDTFLDKLKTLNTLDYFLLKSPVKREYLDCLSKSELPIKFMPIVKNKEELDLVLSYKNIYTVAVELIFETLDSPLIDNNVLQDLKKQGILLWVNALTLNDTTKLSAGLDDNISIEKGCEFGWGKLLDLDIDIIQTDWPLYLKQYINSRN